jgi:transcriptional regulator with XRE-family HTH domain
LVMATTIGEELRLAREGRGIPLREISDQTRISMHYLEAIETNDYKRLPGGIFNRSFVKAYARYVGYDEKEAVDGYTRYMRDELGDTGDEVASTPYHSKVYTDSPATRSPILTVLLAVVILLILTVIALSVVHWVQRRSAGTLTGTVITGTAGVAGSPADVFLSAGVLGPPASSNKFTPDTVEPNSRDHVAFNECGRDARGPRRKVSETFGSSLDTWKADYEQFLQ